MKGGRKLAGFSLLEVNLALFVVAMGMLTLFSLFPAGLRQGQAAHENTQEAMFADHVFSTMRAETMLLTADQWGNGTVFRDRVVARITNGGVVRHTANIVRVEYPVGSSPRQFIRYVLQLDPAGGGLWRASLWCKSGEYGATNVEIFKEGAAKFYTEFFYSGMP